MSTLFHVGYHKTASTALQKHVFPVHSGVHLVPMEESQKVLLEPRCLQFDAEQARRWLEEQRRRAGERVLVVSDEEMSGNPHTGGNGGFLPAAVADRIRRIAPDAHILLVVRRQDEMIESLYRQYVKRGGTRAPADYVFPSNRTPFRFPGFSLDQLRYDDLVACYQDKFGAEHVHVLTYEAFRADPDAFLRDLFRRFGLGLPEKASRAAGKRVNVGLTPTATRVMRVVNRWSDDDPIDERAVASLPRVRFVLANALLAFDRTRPKLRPRQRPMMGPELMASIRDFYRQPNRRLEEITGLDLASHGYPLHHAQQAGLAV